MKRWHRSAAALSALALGITLTACSGSGSSSSAKTETTQSAQGPVTVENCGRTLTFEKSPERVVLLKPAPVLTLGELGVLDKVVAKGGKYPTEYYSDALNKQIAAIPSISDKLDPSGHLEISQEMVVGQNPDLVLGFQKTINKDTMAPTGIPIIEEPASCGGLSGEATWQDMYNHVELYGKIFHKEERAKEYVEELKKRLENVKKPDHKEMTVAVIYPTIGGGVTYAYGAGSMTHPLVQSAGLKNVFADNPKRNFEITAEELVGRNPDFILALYQDDNPDHIIQAVKDLNGASGITAVKENRIMPMLFNYGEPPTPLAIDGLEKLVEYLNTNAKK